WMTGRPTSGSSTAAARSRPACSRPGKPRVRGSRTTPCPAASRSTRSTKARTSGRSRPGSSRSDGKTNERPTLSGASPAVPSITTTRAGRIRRCRSRPTHPTKMVMTARRLPSP
ncbi:MAG: hypothetical protein AVDCRST_MAG64-454, partial [uncultured Phycisphaerae bacterium]